MHAEVLITCSGVDGRTIHWELDLTASTPIQPLTGTKQQHLRFSFLQIKDKFINMKPIKEIIQVQGLSQAVPLRQSRTAIEIVP